MEDSSSYSVEISLDRKTNNPVSQNQRVFQFVENLGDYGSPVPESDDTNYDFFAKVSHIYLQFPYKLFSSQIAHVFSHVAHLFNVVFKLLTAKRKMREEGCNINYYRIKHSKRT